MFSPSLAFGTNGFWPHAYGAKSKAMAGASVAMVHDGMAAAVNPAAMFIVGDELDLGLALFSPRRAYQANNDMDSPPYAALDAGNFSSHNELFLIPSLSYNRRLDPQSTLGITVGANGGMNTEYRGPVFNNFADQTKPETLPGDRTGIDFAQVFAGITYARKVTAGNFLGVTPIIAAQRFKAEGLQPFKPYSLHPDNLTDNGYDYSYGMGLRVGWFGRLSEALDAGISYQSKIFNTRFESYNGLLADEGRLDSPAIIDAGFAYKVMPELTLAFDYQRIFYSDVRAIGNSSALVFPPGGSAQPMLGTDAGLGFGWQDMEIFKLGLQWQYNAQWAIRAGFSQGNEVFAGSEGLFNILAPAVIRRHYTMGFGRTIRNNSELNFAFTYALNVELPATNPNLGPQTFALEMEQYDLEIGWVVKF